MMKKLGIVVMAGLFSVSVAGLSFADEKKAAAPAAPAATGAPANPCAGKEMKKEDKKKAAGKKADDKKAAEAPAAAPAPAAPAKK